MQDSFLHIIFSGRSIEVDITVGIGDDSICPFGTLGEQERLSWGTVSAGRINDFRSHRIAAACQSGSTLGGINRDHISRHIKLVGNLRAFSCGIGCGLPDLSNGL